MNKKTRRCYLDIHVLQTVPPSCVNRDDTGSPKTAVYGGVTRARVSSQAWKRAVRCAFKEIFTNELGKRSKYIVNKISDAIGKIAGDKVVDPYACAREALEKVGIKVDKEDNSTSVLLFFSSAEVEALAGLAVRGEKDKEEYKKALREHPAVDIALFGRMIAGEPSLNYDACVQVAHAISTHKVQNEFDYFTAVDDLKPEDNSGAAFIDTAEFNSATLYRYATINVDELNELIPGDVVKVVKAFVHAFCFSMPTGKRNAFANNTLPDVIYVALRSDQPVSLVGAFEKPIRNEGKGYVAPSERALVKHAKKIYDQLIQKPESQWGWSICENGDDGIASLKDDKSPHDENARKDQTVMNIIEAIGEAVANHVNGDTQ